MSDGAGLFGRYSCHTDGHRVQHPDDTLASRIETAGEGSCSRHSGPIPPSHEQAGVLGTSAIGHQELEDDSVAPWVLGGRGVRFDR